MSEQDPKRLVEGAAGGELRALLLAGRTELPNNAQMLALAAKIGVGAAGAGGAGGGAAGAAGGKAVAGAVTTVKAGLALKVASAMAIVGLAGGGAVVISSRSVTPASPVGIVASVTTTPVATTATVVPAEEAPAASASATAPIAPAASVTRPESPEAEVKLLERAQDALRSRPEEALALCNDHSKRFPSGMLVQEREVIAIEALVKAGRKEEARKRADRFTTRFPGSSHTRRLETMLRE